MFSLESCFPPIYKKFELCRNIPNSYFTYITQLFDTNHKSIVYIDYLYN